MTGSYTYSARMVFSPGDFLFSKEITFLIKLLFE